MMTRAARMHFTSISPDLICLAFNDNPEKKNMNIITTSDPWCILSHLPILETVSLVSATVTMKTRRSPIRNQYFFSKPDTLIRPHDIADFPLPIQKTLYVFKADVFQKLTDCFPIKLLHIIFAHITA